MDKEKLKKVMHKKASEVQIAVPEQTAKNTEFVASPENDKAFEVEKHSDLQKKYGFDIVYNPESNMYMLQQDNKRNMLLTNQDIDFNEWHDNHLEDMIDTFSEKTEIEYKNVDLYTAIRNDKPLLSASYSGDNVVTVYNYQLDESDREDCINIIMDKYNVDEEKSREYLDTLVKGHNNLSSYMSYIEHEISHLEDHKKYGNRQYDMPPEYMAKLAMMTEVRANLAQAGLALDMYKATGNVKYFDDLVSIDTQDLQKALQENPNIKNKEEFVAQYVSNEWLKTHNKPDTYYSQQAYNLSNPHLWNYPIWALEENPNTINQYHERTNAMFENVMGLGDVRKYVNTDFELNHTLKADIATAKDNLIHTETLKKIMTQDAKNAEQYSANLKDFLSKIKEIDADGVRTREEQTRLEEYIKRASQRYDTAHTSTKQQNNRQSMDITMAMQQRLRNSDR